MTLLRSLVAAAVVGVGYAVSAVPASAQTPMLIRQERDWSAITAQGNRGKICYVIAKPQKMTPPNLNHGDVFFFITTRPADNVVNEPSFRVGYSFRENSTVTVDIDGTKFTLFTTADGAWVQQSGDEPRLIQAMRTGKAMTIAGTSGRGNATTYSFQLGGISAALEAASRECKG